MKINEFKTHYLELVRKGVKFDPKLTQSLEQALGLFELFQEREDQGINYDENHNILVSRSILEQGAKTPFNMVHMITYAHEIASVVFEKEQEVTLVAMGEEIHGKGYLCLKKSTLQYTFEYVQLTEIDPKTTYYLYAFNKSK